MTKATIFILSLPIAMLVAACSPKTDTPGGSGSHDTAGPSGGSGGGTSGSGGSVPGSGGATSGSGGSAIDTGNSAAGGTQDARGSGTGSGGGAAEASLVISAPNNYWQIAQPVTVTGAVADLTVDENMLFQTWEGFGGAFNEMGWDALSVVDAAERDRALRLLFANDGARFNSGRIPIGAADYATSRYTLNDTAGDLAMAHFSIERDKKLLIPYVKAALAIRPDLKLWASPWTPPPWMKTNNHYDGCLTSTTGNCPDEGTMKGDANTLKAFALYLARFVEEYGKEGMKIWAVHPQNEPGYALPYPTCIWTPEVYSTFIRDHLGPTFTERNITAEIWLGTMSKGSDKDHVTMTMADANAAKFVKGIGLQWLQSANVAAFSSSYKIPIWQTEHQAGNYPWVTTTFKADKAPNDQEYAEESWGLLKTWIEAGTHSYSAWNMVLDTTGKSLDTVRPWPQNALLAVDRQAKTVIMTPTYYVFRHLSGFVDVGARRAGTTGAFKDAVAFKNGDGSVVVAVYNSDAAARTLTVGVKGTLQRFTVSSHGWATLNWP